MLWQKRFWTIGNKSRFTCFYKSWIRQNAPPRIPLRVKIRGTKEYAGMVELVDSVDLGSTAKSVQVRVLLPAPRKIPLLSTTTREGFSSFMGKNSPKCSKNNSKQGLERLIRPCQLLFFAFWQQRKHNTFAYLFVK